MTGVNPASAAEVGPVLLTQLREQNTPKMEASRYVRGDESGPRFPPGYLEMLRKMFWKYARTKAPPGTQTP